MNILDIMILLGMVYLALRWAKAGLVHGFFSLSGFLIGLLLGAWLLPFLPRVIFDAGFQLTLSVAFMLLIGIVLGGIGERVGVMLSSKTEELKLKEADSILGALFSVLLAGAVVWVMAAVLSTSPYQNLNRAFQESRLVQAINRAFPPAPPTLARIGSALKPFEFPQVFVGPEPQPIGPLAPESNPDLAEIVRLAGTSTVRIEASGCGGQSRGSGFVAAEGTVMTNAHVVAGADSIIVNDRNGRRRATLIYFDPNLDIAVLSAQNLAGVPLPLLAAAQPRGSAAAALGYPGGGNFRATPAVVSRSLQARGLNIYGTRNVTRPIYELQATVVQGNSGGPVVNADGRAIAVIFARSETNSSVGYAITASAAQAALNAALSRPVPLDTGACIAQ